MTILLQDDETQLYMAHAGQWTGCARDARGLVSARSVGRGLKKSSRTTGKSSVGGNQIAAK